MPIDPRFLRPNLMFYDRQTGRQITREAWEIQERQRREALATTQRNRALEEYQRTYEEAGQPEIRQPLSEQSLEDAIQRLQELRRSPAEMNRDEQIRMTREQLERFRWDVPTDSWYLQRDEFTEIQNRLNQPTEEKMLGVDLAEVEQKPKRKKAIAVKVVDPHLTKKNKFLTELQPTLTDLQLILRDSVITMEREGIDDLFYLTKTYKVITDLLTQVIAFNKEIE